MRRGWWRKGFALDRGALALGRRQDGAQELNRVEHGMAMNLVRLEEEDIC